MATNSSLSRLLVFWPGRPWNAGLFFSVAGKATLLWPRLPQNPGLDRAYQAFPGHAFLASLAWPGLPCFWPRSWCKGLNKDVIKLHMKKEKERNTKTYRKKHVTYKFKYRGFCYLKKLKLRLEVYTTYQVNFIKYSIK